MFFRAMMLLSTTLCGQTVENPTGWAPSPLGSRQVLTERIISPSLTITPSLYASAVQADLGVVDSGVPVRGVLTLLNVGGQSYQLRPTKGGVSPLKLALPIDQNVKPGGYTSIPFEYDAHGQEGNITIHVQVESDDPGAPVVGAEFQCKVVTTTKAAPYRNAVVGKGEGTSFTSTQATFAFEPERPEDPFEGVSIEDPSAPLVILELQRPANGRFSGTVTVDPLKITPETARIGEARILAWTRNGRQNYVTLQWVLKE